MNKVSSKSKAKMGKFWIFLVAILLSIGSDLLNVLVEAKDGSVAESNPVPSAPNPEEDDDTEPIDDLEDELI